jgi:hypothetical protein
MWNIWRNNTWQDTVYVVLLEYQITKEFKND